MWTNVQHDENWEYTWRASTATVANATTKLVDADANRVAFSATIIPQGIAGTIHAQWGFMNGKDFIGLASVVSTDQTTGRASIHEVGDCIKSAIYIKTNPASNMTVTLVEVLKVRRREGK